MKKMLVENIIFSLLIAGFVAGLLTLPFYWQSQQARQEFKQINNIDENHLNATTKCALDIFDGFYNQRHQILVGLFFSMGFCCTMTIYPIKNH